MSTPTSPRPLGQGPRALRRRRRACCSWWPRTGSSAFDVVFAEPIPDKGRVLTAMTAFWCERAGRPGARPPGHRRSRRDPPAGAAGLGGAARWPIAGRAMLVRRAEMLPLECIVRGYLAGRPATSTAHRAPCTARPCRPGCGWPTGSPEPMFTPSTKADEGHDENIAFDEAVDLVGPRTAARGPRHLCLDAYRAGRAGGPRRRASSLADTKFELGYVDGELALCDEVVTPDSSRLLAGRPGGAGHHPAGVRQAAAAGLAGGQRLGQDARPRRRCPPEVVRGDLRALRRRLRADHRAPPGRLVRCRVADEVRGPRRGAAAARDRRSRGGHHRAGAARPRLRRRHRRAGRQGRSASSWRRADEAAARGRAEEMADRLLANPVIEERRRRGAVRPPSGTADGRPGRGGGLPRDQLRARRGAAPSSRLGGAGPSCVWHGADDLGRRSTPSSCPAGSPTATTCGPGRLARFSPVMEAVAAFAAAGGPVVGICNGFQVLTEAGSCPGRCRRTAACASCARRSGVRVASDPLGAHRRRSTVGHRAAAARSTTSWATTSATGATLRRAAGRGPGGAALHRQPQRLGRRHRRHLQRRRQRGRPHAPPRAGLRRAARVDRRRACCCGALLGSTRPAARAA